MCSITAPPFIKKLTLDELKQHLFTLPEHPDWIPYRTSYYKDNWGFCISHNQLQSLPEGEYEVFIDSSLEPGHLSYGELFIQGETSEEMLFSCHVCHPSLCNDNLSGIALTSLPGGLPGQPAVAIFVSFPVYSRDHWIDHLACPERGKNQRISGMAL